ncbi:MAG: L-histidine N(alpha)-methyltransferase, partial [Verrucomicrobiota bacterium]|nr:L-histidine N(alpha)-methyltransferase [Verrucomicrobiota bacterium]
MTVHPSQFPGAVRRQLVAALRAGNVPPKFLYDSVRQTQKWLEVHQAHSPSRINADVTRIYDAAFEDALGQALGQAVALVGLGCGGGQKDTRCLAKLQPSIPELHYMPCDVSQAMTLVAREAAAELLPLGQVHPLVCDLAEADDLGQALDDLLPGEAKRVFTFFGMIPNLEPDVILPKLRALLRDGDQLLFSANLAPGRDYRAGVERVLPQYDNAET